MASPPELTGAPAPVPGRGRDDLAARLADLERHRSFDVRARLGWAAEAERDALAAGDDEARMRARLVTADMLQRSGDAADGARRAVEVHAWAAANGAQSLLARSHLVLSSLFEGIGDASAALDHAVRAIDLLGDDASARERGNHLLRLGDALAFAGSHDEARRRYDEASAAFGEAGDRERELNVLNNVAVLECEAGDAVAALDAARRLQRAAGDDELNAAFAETIARALLASGEPAGAEAIVRRGLELLAEQGDAQAFTPAELELTGAEVLLALGRVDAAQAALDRCLAVCASRDLAALRVAALAVQADLHAVRRDFERAYAAHREFHRESVALRSAQQEASARARQALFETAEARREALRFWRQARTDPLTELANRRYVDETLPGELAALAGPAAAAVVAAVVDVDHFKRVNDDFDHPTGDEVLRRLAAVLVATQAAGTAAHRSFAARLGGEEFLVVHVGLEPAQAVARIEEARRAVAALDLSDAAVGLRITISAGVAVARPGDTQLTLLGRADRHLYEAKAAGRDRVVTDPVD